MLIQGEIMWDDLTPSAKKRLKEFYNENEDIPLAIIDLVVDEEDDDTELEVFTNFEDN
jgi:hypothetical protein